MKGGYSAKPGAVEQPLAGETEYVDGVYDAIAKDERLQRVADRVMEQAMSGYLSRLRKRRQGDAA